MYVCDRYVRGGRTGPALVGPIYLDEASLGKDGAYIMGLQVSVPQLWPCYIVRHVHCPSTTALPAGKVQRG